MQRVMAVWLLLLLLGGGVSGQESIEQIAKAWKDRQDRVKSAEFHISATGFYPKGGKSVPTSENKQGAKITPPTDTTTSWSRTVLLSNQKIRTETKGTLWAGGGFETQHNTAVLDGTIRRELNQSDRESRGLVNKEADYFEAKGQSVRPLTRSFRGISPGFRTFLVEDLKPTGVTATIDGRKCVQFVVRRTGGDRDELWLDPSREWISVRELYIKPKPDEVQTQLDIQYEPHPEAGWLPKRWEFRHTRDGRPVCVENYILTSAAINPALPESAFDLSFPVGTDVRDYTEGLKHYVVEEGGREHILLDQTSKTSRQLWTVLACGVVVSVVAFLIWRRHRAVAKRGVSDDHTGSPS